MLQLAVQRWTEHCTTSNSAVFFWIKQHGTNSRIQFRLQTTCRQPSLEVASTTLTQQSNQWCGLGLDVSVSRRTNVSSRSRLFVSRAQDVILSKFCKPHWQNEPQQRAFDDIQPHSDVIYTFCAASRNTCRTLITNFTIIKHAFPSVFLVEHWNQKMVNATFIINDLHFTSDWSDSSVGQQLTAPAER